MLPVPSFGAGRTLGQPVGGDGRSETVSPCSGRDEAEVKPNVRRRRAASSVVQGGFRNRQTDISASQQLPPGRTSNVNKGGRPLGSKDKYKRVGHPSPLKGTSKHNPIKPPNVGQTRWDTLGWSNKVAVWKGYRITDTDEGRDAVRPCNRCQDRELTCRFFKGKSAETKTCGECTGHGTTCQGGDFEQQRKRKRRDDGRKAEDVGERSNSSEEISVAM